MAWTAMRQARGAHVVAFWGGEAWLALALLRRLRTDGTPPPLLVAHSNGIETHATRRLASGAARRRPAWYQLNLSRLYEVGYRRADALVTVSGFERKFALDAGYQPEDRLLAIDNPLPAAYLEMPIREQRSRVITWCGTWLPYKGTRLLVETLPEVLRALPDWRLRLIGVGAGFEPAAHFAADVLDRIEVVRHADREGALRELYQDSAMLLSTSVYESFGLVMAEAMACGAPLVSLRVGFAAGLRDGVEALLADPDSTSLRTVLLRAAADESLRARIAAGGHARVQSLRWDSAVAQLDAAYHHWLGESGGTAAGFHHGSAPAA